MTDIIILKDNGDDTYLGADDTGHLYDGVLESVGFDALDVVTTPTATGFERVCSYKGIIHSISDMDRAAFDKARLRERRDLQEDLPDNHFPDLTQTDLDALWATELGLGSHDKAHHDTPDGPVEKTLKFLTWTEK